jgi:hypothetical protein
MAGLELMEGHGELTGEGEKGKVEGERGAQLGGGMGRGRAAGGLLGAAGCSGLLCCVLRSVREKLDVRKKRRRKERRKRKGRKGKEKYEKNFKPEHFQGEK